MSYLNILFVVLVIAIISVLYAFVLYRRNKRVIVKNAKMEEISSYIQEGSMAFLKREYKIISIFVIGVAAVLAILGLFPKLRSAEGVGWQASLAFVCGAFLSALAGYVGMKSATKANSRVAFLAKEKGMSGALKVAFNGGSILGLCVVGLSLFGLTAIFMIFAYTTKELYKQILYNSPVVTSGSGLYLNNKGEYYFRGKIENNYVAYGSVKDKDKVIDTIWRVISIKDNMVRLKAVKPLRTKTVWDIRFNTTENKYDGYNDFDLSQFSDYLKDLKEENTILNESENAKLVSNKLCIGSRSAQDTTKDGSSECSKYSQDEYYYGTITPYEYIRASLDPDCKTLSDRACSNFNYMADLGQSDEWTVTASTLSNYQSYVFRGSIFAEEKTSNRNSVYPVITLNKYAFFKSGTGTLEDPYRIK